MIESDYLKDNSEFIEKLRQIPALQPFEEKEFNGLLRLSKIKKYESGELIIKEGTYDNWIFFIVSGKVRVTKHGEELTVLKGRGDLFGEMGIIDGSARSASVYAIDNTVCLSIDASYIDRLSGNDRLVFCYILFRVFSEILANRLRLTSEELIRAKEEIASLRGKE